MINEKLIPQYKKWLIFKTDIYQRQELQAELEVCLWTKLYATYVKQWTTTADS
jgi:hypothetical protein